MPADTWCFLKAEHPCWDIFPGGRVPIHNGLIPGQAKLVYGDAPDLESIEPVYWLDLDRVTPAQLTKLAAILAAVRKWPVEDFYAQIARDRVHAVPIRFSQTTGVSAPLHQVHLMPDGDPNDREYLKEMGRTLAAKLPDNHGFILLTFPFGPGGDGSRLRYISNAQRVDAINMLKEFLIKAGAGEDWMKHLP